MPHIAGLFSKCERFRLLDAAFPGLVAVDEEGHLPTLRDTTAVIGELHPELMLARRKGVRTLDVGLLQAEKVVTVLRLAILRVQAPTHGDAAHGRNNVKGAQIGFAVVRRVATRGGQMAEA